jgi:hypothetical protein
MNENTNTTNTTNTNNEKGNTMNENMIQNTITADELGDKRGYWMQCKSVTIEDKDGNEHAVRLVPFASVVVGYVPEDVAHNWHKEHRLAINGMATEQDKESGCLRVWGCMEHRMSDNALMVKAPVFYYDGLRIDGITEAAEFVAPNEKGRYSRTDACARVENISESLALNVADCIPEWHKATEKRAELVAKAAEKRAREEERNDINRLADMLISFGMEPEKARKRAAEQYRKAKADKASRTA